MPLRSAELLSVALFPGKKRVSTKEEVMRLYGRELVRHLVVIEIDAATERRFDR
jgi:hypothetical protein